MIDTLAPTAEFRLRRLMAMRLAAHMDLRLRTPVTSRRLAPKPVIKHYESPCRRYKTVAMVHNPHTIQFVTYGLN